MTMKVWAWYGSYWRDLPLKVTIEILLDEVSFDILTENKK
jgi:hypothetical protein